jgi:acyl dehydratase
MAADWYFDDLLPGHRFTTPGVTVSEAQILDFARVYDPQPFHIDSEAARDTEFGGLIASGFHTLSLSFAQFFRLEVFAKANLGSPGMEDLRWLKPLRPGDTIRVEAEVMEVKPSQSKADRCIVVMRHDTFNQRGELILTVTCLHRLKRRGQA